MKVSGAELLVSGLKKAGIELVLGIPGGTVIPLYDALYEGGEGLRFVLTRHEQSAAHIADGYAQETDVFNLTMPIVKHSFMAQRAGDIPRLVQEAAYIAQTGRPGPVLIDIPRDVAEAAAGAEAA